MTIFQLTEAQLGNVERAGRKLGFHASYVSELGYYVISHNGERAGHAETYNEAMSLIALELPIEEDE